MPEKVTASAPAPVKVPSPPGALPVEHSRSMEHSTRAPVLAQTAFDKETKARAFRQDRQDRSLSSESSISSQDSFLSADALPTGAPVKPASAQSEKCPLCRATDLKIVVVHGKPQPLIGQLCARCSLIVCSKCGLVKKDSQNKKAFWMCAQCANIPWEPSDMREPEPPRPVETPPSVYIAPLTHLVTADNTICSEAIRGSLTSFADEPEYMLPTPLDTLPEPPPDLYQQDDDWGYVEERAYPKFDMDNLPTESYVPTMFRRLPEEPEENMGSPEPPEGYREVERMLQGPMNSMTYQDDSFWQRNNPPPVMTMTRWPEEEPTLPEPYLDDIQQFSSQESLYEIQEEETSDYGSQIQAACSEINSLSSSTSTSGNDFRGNGEEAGGLRRSHFVENFRQMPRDGKKTVEVNKGNAGIVQKAVGAIERRSGAVTSAGGGGKVVENVQTSGHPAKKSQIQSRPPLQSPSRPAVDGNTQTDIPVTNQPSKTETPVSRGNHVHFHEAPPTAAQAPLQEAVAARHRPFLHQSSRDDLLGMSEIESEFDSVMEGNVVDNFDTVSQSSMFSGTSTSCTFPASSSMTGLNKEERRCKRRLPLLPKDDQAGYSITPEERERQKRELKRRISGHLLKLGPPPEEGDRRSSSMAIVQGWSNELPASVNGSGVLLTSRINSNKVVKRKKHKHSPATPHDAEKLQLLKQQLRALAAHRDRTGYGDEKVTVAAFGSLPNKPLNSTSAVSSLRDDVLSSSNEYLTDTTLGSIKKHHNLRSVYQPTSSDPALFRSVLEQYRRQAQEDDYQREREERERYGSGTGYREEIGGSRRYSQYQSDPDIQEIVNKLQQINREIADTKALFRSTSSLALSRRHPGPRWRSETDLSRMSPTRPPYRRDFPPEDMFFRDGDRFHPLALSHGFNRRGMWEEDFFRNNDYDYRMYPPEEWRGFRDGAGPYFPFVEPLPYPPPPPGSFAGNFMESDREFYPFEPFDEPGDMWPPPMQVSSPLVQNGPVSNESGLDVPLPDSRVSAEEPTTLMNVEGDAWEEDKENASETGSEGLDVGEKLSRSMSLKKPKKDSGQPKYAFPTKRILLTRDPKDRSLSGNGLGVRIAGGKLIPNTNTLAAFISKIYDNGIMATLGEAKEGDQVLEWNGIPLTNKSYEEVQEVLEKSNGEVEILLRNDYNVRDLEAELEQQRIARRASHQAEKANRQYDNGDRSPGPGRTLFGQPQRGRAEKVEEEEVYRPRNQLAPPSPMGIMQRKKSTTSSGHQPVTGDILLRMTYERCTLTLQVLKARNLKAADKSGYSDPYCKIVVVPGRSEYKYKTRHIMQTLNPEWKETFTFQGIDPNEIHHKHIDITVWDWDRLSADDFLGEVTIDLADPIHLDGSRRWYPLGERRPGETEEQ